MSQDIYNDFVTATRGAPSSQAGAQKTLAEDALGVASLVQLYKEVEKQTGQPLVGNPAKSALYDALDHAALALAEAAYARKPEAADVTAAAKYLSDSPEPTARGVLERVSGAIRERDGMRQDFWSLIHAGTQPLQGKEIPGELAGNAHAAAARMEGGHHDLLAQIQKLNDLPDGELRNKGILATALVIEQGGYDPSAQQHHLHTLEHAHAPQQQAELSR